jgi:hypothetical protein
VVSTHAHALHSAAPKQPQLSSNINWSSLAMNSECKSRRLRIGRKSARDQLFPAESSLLTQCSIQVIGKQNEVSRRRRKEKEENTPRNPGNTHSLQVGLVFCTSGLNATLRGHTYPYMARVRIGAVEGGTGFEFGRAEERDVGGRFPFCIRTNGNNEVRIPNALQFQSKHSSLAW